MQQDNLWNYVCEKVKLIIETCVLCIRIYIMIGNIIQDIYLDPFHNKPYISVYRNW